MVVFFFKQKTAYEVRISDWSSDVCSSDLNLASESRAASTLRLPSTILPPPSAASILAVQTKTLASLPSLPRHTKYFWFTRAVSWMTSGGTPRYAARSEEHTSELQSRMRISSAGFSLNKKTDPSPRRTVYHKHKDPRD